MTTHLLCATCMWFDRKHSDARYNTGACRLRAPSVGSGERELDHYDACGDLAQAFMAVVMERAAESDARCMAKYYSLGHKQEMECQMPSGHVGMHSMAWDGKTCQWTNGGA